MPVLTLPLLGTVATIAVTAVAFVLLTRRSAGGPVSWSIAAGMARGVGAWSRNRRDPRPDQGRSPRAAEPIGPLDTTGLPLPPLQAHSTPPDGPVVAGADPEFLAGVEIEELDDHRI